MTGFAFAELVAAVLLPEWPEELDRTSSGFFVCRVKKISSAAGTNSVEKWITNSNAMWCTPTGERYLDSSDSRYPLPMPSKYTAFAAKRTQSRMQTAVI